MIEVLVYLLMSTSKYDNSGHVVRQVAMFKTQQQCEHVKSELVNKTSSYGPVLKCIQANILVPR